MTLDRPTALETYLVGLAAQHGIDTSTIPRDISVLARTQPDADIEAFAVLIRALRQAMNDELLGMTTRPVLAGVFDIVMRSVLRCRNLRELLGELVTATELIYSPPDLCCRIGWDTHEFSISYENAFVSRRELYFEYGFLATWRGLCWLLDERLDLKRVDFTASDSRWRDDLRHLFPCEVRTAQARNALIFEPHCLNLPIRRDAQEIEQYLARRPLDILYLPGHDRRLQVRVMRLLQDSLRQQRTMPSSSLTAETLGMPEHTMRRQLAREGHTLQDLKDRVRHDSAKRLLAGTNVPVGQIADELGFREPNSFCRAFRRWAGASPQAFRAGQNK